MKPIVLDLFCGAGGASMGYFRAGFEVVGVDIAPQKNYPFEFIQADWEEPLSYLPGLWEREGRPYMVHASPPCQRYSTMTAKWNRQAEHPDLVEPVQMALREVSMEGAPYVIENVMGAPLDDAIVLCGTMFGLGAVFEGRQYELQRHRQFESSTLILPPKPCKHEHQPIPVYGHAGGSSKRDGLRFPDTNAWRSGMGINWMSGKELAESIPPAYTEHVGRQISRAMMRHS